MSVLTALTVLAVAVAGVAGGIAVVLAGERLSTGGSTRSAGIVGSVGAVLVDVVAFGGDVVIGLVFLLIDQVDVILAIVAQTTRLSDHVSWIPERGAELALAAVAALFVLVMIVRLSRRGINRINN